MSTTVKDLLCGPPARVISFLSKSDHARARRYVLWSVVFTILALTVSMAITTKLILHGVNDQVPFTGSSSGQISLVANFLDLDATQRMVTVDWFPLSVHCPSPEMVVNIFVDPNLLTTGNGGMASSDPASTPVFQFNSTKQCGGSNHDSFNVFRTVFKLTGLATPGALDRESLQAYPYDRYLFQISMYASLASTNETIGIILAKSFGTPVNFDIKLDGTRSINNDEGVLLSFVASRSAAVVGLVGIIISANWLVTIAFLWITTAAFFYDKEIVTEMVAVPIGALFVGAIIGQLCVLQACAGAHCLRNTDYYGILPNLVLMTLCGAILLLRVLERRVRGAQSSDAQSDNVSGELQIPIEELTSIVLKLGTVVDAMGRQTLPTRPDFKGFSSESTMS